MAKEKKERKPFVLDAMPEDLGVKQYAFVQGGKKEKNDGTGERKKLWRSPASIYLFVVLAFLVFWFLYTLIAAIIRYGAQAILKSVGDIFALAVCAVIIVCTACGLWSKFARFALNHGLVKSRERALAENSAEMMDEAYEKLEKAPPVFEVYEDYVIGTDGEEIKVFDRARIGKIFAYKAHGQVLISLMCEDGLSSDFFALKGLRLPLREIKKLKAIFGDKLSIEPLFKHEEEKRLSRFREALCNVNWAGIITGLVTAAVGGGVIALHYTIAESIPITLGAFFVAAGALVFCVGLSSLPIVKVFIVPLIAGGIFVTIPYQFCKIIVEADGASLVFNSVDDFLSSFNGMFCAAFFLSAIGLLCVIAAFVGLVKYIKYGED